MRRSFRVSRRCNSLTNPLVDVGLKPANSASTQPYLSRKLVSRNTQVNRTARESNPGHHLRQAQNYVRHPNLLELRSTSRRLQSQEWPRTKIYCDATRQVTGNPPGGVRVQQRARSLLFSCWALRGLTILQERLISHLGHTPALGSRRAFEGICNNRSPIMERTLESRVAD